MVYLFVHVIWCVRGREALLSKPVRRVLFAHLQKDGEEKGIRIVAAGASCLYWGPGFAEAVAVPAALGLGAAAAGASYG